MPFLSSSIALFISSISCCCFFWPPSPSEVASQETQPSRHFPWLLRLPVSLASSIPCLHSMSEFLQPQQTPPGSSSASTCLLSPPPHFPCDTHTSQASWDLQKTRTSCLSNKQTNKTKHGERHSRSAKKHKGNNKEIENEDYHLLSPPQSQHDETHHQLSTCRLCSLESQCQT